MNTPSTIEYSFVIAIYNDAYLADDFCKAYENTFQQYLGIQNISDRVELIFVDDGSIDDSWAQLKQLIPRYPFVRLVRLSRNFGQHMALACGFREARGQYVGRLNVDMQDPPSEIPKLLDVVKNEDVDLVVGQYDVRRSNVINKLTAYLFFMAFNWLTGRKTPQNTSPLRVMNRRFLEVYNSLQESTRFPQGLENWIGFKHKYIRVVHRPRADNRSTYTFRKRLQLAVDGAIAFSDRPMKIVVYAGFLITFSGILLSLYTIARKIIFNSILKGYTSIISMITIFSGLEIMVIGITGLYVGRILQEVQNRPEYIIRERENF